MVSHIQENTPPNKLWLKCTRCNAHTTISTDFTEDGYIAIRARADAIMAERKTFIDAHTGVNCPRMPLDPIQQERIRIHI